MENNRILFLDDDIRRCEIFLEKIDTDETIDVVYDAFDCIAKLKENEYEVAFLDHDLGGEVGDSETEENSGSGVVRWIVKNKPKIGEIIVHSFNAPAAIHMVTDLQAVGYKARHVPFYLLFAK